MDATKHPPQGDETPRPEAGAPNPPAADDGGRPLTRCVFRLSERDYRAVLDAYDNPGEPTESMKKARRKYDEAAAAGRLVVSGSTGRTGDDLLFD